MLSQKRPKNEVRIDDAYVPELDAEMPSDTYAYTTFDPFVMSFDKSVSFQSFWIRLHAPVNYYQQDSHISPKIVRIYD